MLAIDRAVMPESGLGLNSGLESVFYWTRNWPGMEGPGIGIGPEWAQLDSDSEPIPVEVTKMMKVTL